MGEAFAGHGRDLVGVGLVVFGVVAGLGLYGDFAGPVGRLLAEGLLVVTGLLAYVVPPALIVGGALTIRQRGEEDTPSPLRPVIGGVLGVLALSGLLHLISGRDPEADLDGAGGYVGVAAGGPLVNLFGSVAAAVLLVAVATIGAVVASNRNLHEVASATGRFLRPVRDVVVRGWRALFTLGEDATPPADDEGLLSAAEAAVAPPAPVAVTADPGDLTPSWLQPSPLPTVVVPGASGPDAPDADPGADPDATVSVPAPDLDDETSDAGDDGLASPGGLVVPPLDDAGDSDEVDDDAGPPEQLTIDLGPAALATPWKLPKPVSLERSDRHEVDTGQVERRGQLLQQALADHGVQTRLVGMVVGPTVTRFELELGAGVKVAKLTSLNRDIAYAMASPDVRILAPIPGKQAIGVEVPNDDRQVVSLGDVLSSEEARKATNPLEVALGRDINGRNILVDLAAMPHLLIAGQTGAGKSSCINSLITSVLMRATPDQVRMILIDPKRVELGQYNRLPHLLTQVVTNPKKAANALSWAVREMERRYDLLSETGFRDIGGYNSAFDRGELNDPDSTGDEPKFTRQPYILVVVDELNDLMMVAARDVEDSICRIAQMARAVGIHLVVATQRPSVNVITGVIKANIPARLAFAVSSLADSRVILDQPGAERLVGRGDLLLVGATSSIAQRIQGCWVSEREVRTVVGHWRRQAPDLAFDDAAVQGTDDPSRIGGGGTDASGGDDDELLVAATELVVQSQLGSTSMLQRKLRVGFARAGRLMDLLEQRGVVGPSEGSKARVVLMSPEELAGESYDDNADAEGTETAEPPSDEATAPQ
jgi:DNA segregation ATPase FtsK/SpoIIIE, S-DNA-T family